MNDIRVVPFGCGDVGPIHEPMEPYVDESWTKSKRLIVGYKNGSGALVVAFAGAGEN